MGYRTDVAEPATRPAARPVVYQSRLEVAVRSLVSARSLVSVVVGLGGSLVGLGGSLVGVGGPLVGLGGSPIGLGGSPGCLGVSLVCPGLAVLGSAGD